MIKVDVITNAPTPYSAAFFRSLSRSADLRVHYETSSLALTKWRLWQSDLLEGYDGVIHNGSRVGRFGFWAPDLLSALRRDADLLLLTGSYTSPTILSILFRISPGPPNVFWGERFMTERPVFTQLRRFALRRVDCVFAVGHQAAGQYRKVTGAPVHVLPYTCAMPTRQPSSPSPFGIGFVGQLIWRKGVDLLFQALEGRPEIHVDIIGRGPIEQELRQEATRRQLDVTWRGECPYSEIYNLRSRWLFQVVPSRYDGWGVVVNESLAAGTPVVVSSSAGAAELVHQDVNGWVHLANDVDSLAESIDQACTRSADHDVRFAARLSGEAFSADESARFFLQAMARPQVEQSFIVNQWRQVEARLSRRLDPEDGVPHAIRGDDSPPA